MHAVRSLPLTMMQLRCFIANLAVSYVYNVAAVAYYEMLYCLSNFFQHDCYFSSYINHHGKRYECLYFGERDFMTPIGETGLYQL